MVEEYTGSSQAIINIPWVIPMLCYSKIIIFRQHIMNLKLYYGPQMSLIGDIFNNYIL